jgi:hypothetical protein
MLALCGLASMNYCFANPPLTQRTPARGGLHVDLPSTLDLRPAATSLAADKNSEAFPSSLHRQTLGAQQELQLPGSGFAVAQPRPMGGVEEFARRVHREGLPVARLWENRSALVSLGLNQKGKPGLWIVQKTH